MAIAFAQQIIANGPRNLVLKYTASGTTGDAAAAILVNVSGFVDANGVALGANALTLMSVQASIIGFSAQLLWDASANVNLITIPDGQPFSQDYSKFGGIKDNSTTTSTGDVDITTTGFTAAAGDGGHIYLWFRKT